jgi:hypothetical protein
MLLVIAKASLPALEFAPRRSHSPPLFSSLGAALAWSATRYLLRSAHIKAHSAGDAAAVDRSWVSTMATMMAPTIGAKTYNRRATRFTSKVRFAPDLYGAFPVKRLFWVVLTVFCSERERPFFVPSPAIRFPERAEGVKGPKR